MNTLKAILMIVTSASEIAAGEATGLWLEEFAVPYVEFTDAGFMVQVASIEGGKAPIDPRSLPDDKQKQAWLKAIKALDNTLAVASVDVTTFDAVFMPGGHGTMFDFPQSVDLQRVLSDFAAQDKVIAAMCHGPASLVGVTLQEGTPFVEGKTLTSFTNGEEVAAGFTEKMPFLLETRLRELGANFVGDANWSDHVQVDGKLITGQNPQSSKSTALAVITAMKSQEG